MECVHIDTTGRISTKLVETHDEYSVKIHDKTGEYDFTPMLQLRITMGKGKYTQELLAFESVSGSMSQVELYLDEKKIKLLLKLPALLLSFCASLLMPLNVNDISKVEKRKKPKAVSQTSRSLPYDYSKHSKQSEVESTVYALESQLDSRKDSSTIEESTSLLQSDDEGDSEEEESLSDDENSMSDFSSQFSLDNEDDVDHAFKDEF
tara:strand:+ start:1827 stop:2447 length:621 start_codon:yes stop_codon:yes gene_type:complete